MNTGLWINNWSEKKKRNKGTKENKRKQKKEKKTTMCISEFVSRSLFHWILIYISEKWKKKKRLAKQTFLYIMSSIRFPKKWCNIYFFFYHSLKLNTHNLDTWTRYTDSGNFILNFFIRSIKWLMGGSKLTLNNDNTKFQSC